MINVSDALGVETTSKVEMHIPMDGTWDDDNQWVAGGYSPAIPLRMTPIPVGDHKVGTHGQALKPEKYGERIPATMKFHSKVELPLNAVIVFGGLPYKLTRRGNYTTAGYWSGVGMTIENFELVVVDDEEALSQTRLRVGAREVTVAQLLVRVR